MKLKDKQTLKRKTLNELENDLNQATQELIDLKFKLKVNKLKNLHLPVAKRQQIAIIKTLITQKRLAEKR